MSSCENCSIRARYDRNPKSIVGKLWRWHIGFCPGWKEYFSDLPEEKKLALSEKYHLGYKAGTGHH